MKNVAIVMGGYSDEYKISLKSGETIFKHVDLEKYHPYKVVILKNDWYADVDGVHYPICKSDFSFTINDKKVVFDVAFNIIHGTPGEDGMIQAYFDVIGISHTSCPFYESALTFNKKDTLAVLEKQGYPVAKSVFLNQNSAIDVDEIVEKVGLPCFVKPNRAGSSLGASKVENKEDLPKAIDFAFGEDKDILIESFLDGTEVSVGVVDFTGKIEVLGITEIVSHNSFFDYEAKYAGQSEEITPARLSTQMTQKINTFARDIYYSLNMSGLSRSEFIIVGDTPYFLEMNTNPGFSESSILPQQLTIAGFTVQNMVTEMLEKAMNK